MTKEELIARLKELGEKLDREVSLVGTKEELALRVAELEDELGDDEPQEEQGVRGAGGETPATDTQPSVPGSPDSLQASAELVLVEARVTLHIEAWHENRDERVTLVGPGIPFRVSADDAAVLLLQGLVLEL